MISICCVGFASLDIVCDDLNDCAWNLGLYQLSDKCSFRRVYLCFCMSEVREFESWITGVCSPYVVSLYDFAYYVVA